MEETTLTDGVDQSSSGTGDAPLLEQDNEQSAVEQQNDTDSSESNDSGSESSSSTDESSDEDKGLAKFAKSQGFEDYDSLSEDAKKALKIAQKQVQKDRKELQEKANQRKVSDELEELTKPSENDDASQVLLKRMARLETENSTTKFWSEHQDERKYEGKMAELLVEEKNKWGDDAAWRLAQDLPRLLREAKFAEGAFDSDAARDAGRREERERLRKTQEGSAETAHASQSVAQTKQKVDRDWVENTYDPSNPEHQKLLDTAISRGDLY